MNDNLKYGDITDKIIGADVDDAFNPCNPLVRDNPRFRQSFDVERRWLSG